MNQMMLPGLPALGCHCGNILGPWGWEQRGVAPGEPGGRAGLEERQALPAPLPVLCLRPALPPSQPCKRAFCAAGFFPPF